MSVLVNADGGDEEWLAEHVAEHPDTPVRLDGSTRWLLFKQNRPWGLENYKSFPSGHAVSAFAMAAFLIALYPQGRWLWLALAIGCMLSRVYFRMHYFEDTLFAAGEGWLIAHWVFSRPFAVRLAKLAEQRIPRVRVNEPEWARVQPPLAPLTSAASAADEEPGG
ncbi:MAG: PAP2 superfamily protein [candidate division BRC1 bacterium ADurb.BinA364]|nr:MAG: PAP2 superfamily protein [candidate division BRC1 bacterium ADurb.BinA364]